MSNSLIHTPNNEDALSLYTEMNNNSQQVNLSNLEQRKREILTYSVLLAFMFGSPIALVGLYFGLKANNQIKENNGSHQDAEKSLRKAHFINLAAFIINTLLFLTYLVISMLLLFFFNNRRL